METKNKTVTKKTAKPSNSTKVIKTSAPKAAKVSNTPIVKLETIPTEITRRGKGRPEGVKSFLPISLRDLNMTFKEDAVILIDRKFLLTFVSNKAQSIPTIPIVMTEPENDLKPTVTEFTEENPAALPE